MNKKLFYVVIAAAFVVGFAFARKHTHKIQPTTTQFRPCVWPNTCATDKVAALPVTTCQWPNTCSA